MTTYAGMYVLDTEPSRETRDDEFNRSMTRLDSGTGRVRWDAHDEAPMVVRPFRWIAFGRTEITALRTFLDDRKGRAVPFWCPTWDADLILAADLTAASSAITIQSCGYTQYLFPSRARRRLAIMTSPGVFIFRKVMASVDAGSTETLDLDSALGVNVSKDQAVICFMPLYRLRDDENEIYWHTVDAAECSLRMVEIPMEIPA